MNANANTDQKTAVTKLTDGPLFALYQAVTEHFIHGIDPGIHVEAYVGAHPVTFAETEFAGKYLDTCVRYAKETKSMEALAHAELVVASIIRNQREDGYIGGLEPGCELEWFGIWNQAFTMLGLISYYDLTKDQQALLGAERIGMWVSETFLGGADINSGINNGSQHLSILLPMVQLWERTKKPLFRAFILHIIEKIKASDNNFFCFDSIMELRSKKGIENFVILLGLVAYGKAFGDAEAIESCKKYWDELERTQIRQNGNGTLVEFWTPSGNAPQILKVEDKPDENCVAVGWMEFTTALFRLTGEAKYLYALEKTLFNHILGAADTQGRDFGYYQPNYGKRASATAENMYKCCRYRGYSIVSQLPEMLFFSDETTVIPMIYTGCAYEDPFWEITAQAAYPAKGHISFSIRVKKSSVRTLKLRLPDHYNRWTLTVDGAETAYETVGGYMDVICPWEDGEHSVSLTAEIQLEKECATIQNKNYVSYRHGCMLLAAEVQEEQLASAAVNADAHFHSVPVTGDEMVAYFDGENRLVEYATAGRKEGKAFTVWIPIKD